MKRRKLKFFVLPTFTVLLFSGFILCLLIMSSSISNEKTKSKKENFTYSNDTIIHDVMPVLSDENIIIRPYDISNINIYKKFYDENNNDENSIIYNNNTYMQNSGILYKSDNEYNILSILDGEIIDVKEDPILGYSVEIKHDNNLISSYSGLKNIIVKKNDKINQGSVIGKSGEIKFDEVIKNSLLFELIKDGKYVNPENYYNKKIKEV